MDNLEYSNDALEVLSDFYNCEFTLYVEGEDDIVFWKNIFDLSSKTFHIEDAGGINELKKYIYKIKNEDVNIYVARDNDYCDFLEENMHLHERIFSTYGHSIENTIYNFSSIRNIIKNFSRSKNDLSEEIEDEFNSIIQNFENAIKPILIYEIANDVFQKGISVLGTNSCKFLKSNNSINLCETKINIFIEQNSGHFSVEELDKVATKLENIEKPIWSLVRGHFLTNFVINLIKKIVKKICAKNINLPLDVVYPLLIDKTYLQNSDDIFHYNFA